MMYAAIDAGSNTLRLLVGKVEQGRVLDQTYQRRVCRLAGNFSSKEGLAADARERTLSVFKEFAEYCRMSDVSHVSAVGTAAFRQAVNGKAFAEEIFKSTGLPLKIISGEEEAKLTALGVLSALKPVPANALIVDVGGGSTEYVLSVEGDIVWSSSYALGVVRLTEGSANLAERSAEIFGVTTDVAQVVAGACDRYGISPGELSVVGTAGTVTTLAALDMAMDDYDWRRVNNYLLPYNSLLQWYQRLCPLSPIEREALPGMEQGRGDLIIPGLEIILSLLEELQIDHLVSSDFGILEGLLLCIEKAADSQSFD